MRIFDCHLHVEQGLDKYDLDIEGGNIIFNRIIDYQNFLECDSRFTVSLIFDYRNNFEFIRECLSLGKIVALKIHSRIQQISSSDYVELIGKLLELGSEIPIIYDAFYYGKDLRYQPDLLGLIEILNIFPNRAVIVAHCGGYDLLKYFFHLREFDNVYFDLSLTLQYLSDSSLLTDLIKLIKFTGSERLMFGSDYHYASPVFQSKVLSKILHDLNFDERGIENVFFYNAYRIFVGNDSIQ